MVEKIRKRYRPFIEKRGGIFTPARRRRLLKYSPGRLGYSEADANFRYKVRLFVKQALVDLELFLDVADDKDVNRIINQESLKPIAQALFARERANTNMARIANLFIRYGLYYLKEHNPIRLLDVFDIEIDKALKMSEYLTECIESFSREEAAGNKPIRAQ